MNKPINGVALGVLGGLAVFSQQVSAQDRPPIRITQAVDDSRRVPLRGNRHALARPEFDRGPAPDSLLLERMLLVLARSPEQEADLTRLLDEQQDPRSPNFRKWLTPEEFGQRFGPSDADVQAVTGWLRRHGFRVEQVSRGRGFVEFSGSARQVQQAFHTAIRRFVVNGDSHWANTDDPEIPAALAPVVLGVASLHDFRTRPQSVSHGERVAVHRPGLQPQINLTNGAHALSPADYRVLYNINPLADAGINGAGAVIAVVGRTNINPTDVANFRSLFGLPDNPPEIIVNGVDPGNLGGIEELEAVLDVEWAGATAPNAAVKLVVSKSTSASDGVILSEMYIVDHNLADIITESFGDCEQHYPQTTATALGSIRRQAAAQGITFLVATGDTGAAGCDRQGQITATGPLGVNILASSPYNIAVGGTQFNDSGMESLYWSPTQGPALVSAIAPIPESAWNSSCSPPDCPGSILAAGGGNSIFFPKPPWQSGVPGIPNDGFRSLPDVSLAASSTRNPYALCLQGSCVPNAERLVTLHLAGGTSASTPALAGILGLVKQSVNQRLGQANHVLYRLAAAQTYAECEGSKTDIRPAPACVFNDTTTGTISVPGLPGHGTPGAPYEAGFGYDLATGLGSINATNLVRQWNSVSFSETTITLSVNPTTLEFGNSVNLTFTVTANSGGGVPTGDVSLITSTGVSLGFGPLNGGVLNSTTTALPAGSYTLRAHYSGDTMFAASDSAPVSVNVAAAAVSANPVSLTFGGQTQGTSSAPQVVTLTNAGNVMLNLAGISLAGSAAGDFAQTNTCSASLAPGANCAISVVFRPLATGSRTASIVINSNAPGSPLNIPLSGTGLPATELSELHVEFTSIVGSAAALGNFVSLSRPAPPGGVRVALSSSHPTVAVVPSSVIVFEGATTSGIFNITTSVVQTAVTVTFAATLDGVSKTDTLVVNPLAVTSVILSPASLTGGAVSTENRVALNVPAPPEGVVVALSSDNPAVASVPAVVVVVGGQVQSPPFAISTRAVASAVPVTITARCNGTASQATLTVNPASTSSTEGEQTVLPAVALQTRLGFAFLRRPSRRLESRRKPRQATPLYAPGSGRITPRATAVMINPAHVITAAEATGT